MIFTKEKGTFFMVIIWQQWQKFSQHLNPSIKWSNPQGYVILVRLVSIRRTTHRHTATNQTNQSRQSWKSTPRRVTNVSFSWNKYEQRLNNTEKTFFKLIRDKLRINLSNKSEGKHAYRPPSWIFLRLSLWPLYGFDRAFETIPQAYSSMIMITVKFRK